MVALDHDHSHPIRTDPSTGPIAADITAGASATMSESIFATDRILISDMIVPEYVPTKA
jgi:hypothetical protein